MSIERQLIVFDFDWSMADQDTDRWIFEVLAPDIRREMKSLKDEIQWTDLVAQSLRKIHERNVTRDQIEHTLRIMPFHPAMVRAINKLKSEGKTTFFCLSNANSVFISTILKDKGLVDHFEEIITNPAEFTPSGLLSLRRRIDPNGPQHDCKIGCEELMAFLERHAPEYDRVVYVGDGSNDFCPVLRLRAQDMILCRRFRGLEKRIVTDGEKLGMQCQVKYWAGAWEVEELFAELSC
ncbi:hypothetical protein ONZ45_g964 [Pleurotus djamor]|nr:hypothetical protein ONZ45_g964 [Pleurotus djamor]